jgi:acyl-coenzyme A thioesterase PaaI-like protein
MKWSPRTLRIGLNLYGPYLGAGVKVNYIARDWREARVSMKLRWYNRNAVGTHFGGSLYAMVDPHLMLMLMHLLGDGYVVWDKAAQIDFKKPGRGTVHSTIRITDEDLDLIRRQTVGGKTFLPEFDLEVVDGNGNLIATVKKILYVRKKTERDRSSAPATK